MQETERKSTTSFSQVIPNTSSDSPSCVVKPPVGKTLIPLMTSLLNGDTPPVSASVVNATEELLADIPTHHLGLQWGLVN